MIHEEDKLTLLGNLIMGYRIFARDQLEKDYTEEENMLYAQWERRIILHTLFTYVPSMDGLSVRQCEDLTGDPAREHEFIQKLARMIVEADREWGMAEISRIGQELEAEEGENL